MATQSLIHVTVLLVAVTGSFAALPNGWKTCSRGAKDYEICLAKEIQHAIRTLADGDRKLAVLPLDPLRITHMEVPKVPGPVNLELIFNDLDLFGIKNIEIINIKNDWKTLQTEVRIPNLIALGDYKIDGNVLVLPITGNGKCNLTFHEMTLKFNVNINKIQKNGKSYFQMEKLHLWLGAEKFYIYLTNLFNGDKALGDNMNRFLNENSVEILMELNPGISVALSKVFTQIANTVFSRIPADEIEKK